jgi:hypothetical protein
MSRQRYVSGQTNPDKTVWWSDGINLHMHVDTSAAEFKCTPIYVCSIGGGSNHWAVVGASAVHCPTSRGFELYLRHCDKAPLTPELARQHGWYINWMGVESVPD